MSSPNAAVVLAELVEALANTLVLDDLCRALESGILKPSSTGPIRASIAAGRTGVEGQIKRLQTLWISGYPEFSGPQFAAMLRVTRAGIAYEREQSIRPQVVWTGPVVEGSYLRATREVVRELVNGAQAQLLIVGYWLAARSEGEGIIEELIDLLCAATDRGVAITVVLDERKRFDGKDNRLILTEVWPSTVQLPRLMTWRLPADDKHLKLHAKVLVADGNDALVTSANLTMYAMDRNMEMGVRVYGKSAEVVSAHFGLLIEKKVLEAF